MADILISGLINVETTLQVEAFPIPYFAVRYPFFGINSSVSGVGYNVARALTRLGHSVRLLSLVGSDPAGALIEQALAADGIPDAFVLKQLSESAHSVILYDGAGRRQINVDLKDIQEQAYPEEVFAEARGGVALAVLCNINFSRPFLEPARAAGMEVATDVHMINSLDDEYNRDFMVAADILFMSDEALPCPPEQWAERVLERYRPAVVVIGMGAAGSVLAVREDNFIGQVAAVQSRPVVSTIGAGDALFSAFLHSYLGDHNPYEAIRKATIFASYKIGAAGAAEGLLDAEGLETVYKKHTG